MERLSSNASRWKSNPKRSGSARQLSARTRRVGFPKVAHTRCGLALARLEGGAGEAASSRAQAGSSMPDSDSHAVVVQCGAENWRSTSALIRAIPCNAVVAPKAPEHWRRHLMRQSSTHVLASAQHGTGRCRHASLALLRRCAL